MDTALPQKFPFILDRNLAKANCTEDRICTSCDTVVLGFHIKTVNSFVIFCTNILCLQKMNNYLRWNSERLVSCQFLVKGVKKKL